MHDLVHHSWEYQTHKDKDSTVDPEIFAFTVLQATKSWAWDWERGYFQAMCIQADHLHYLTTIGPPTAVQMGK